MKSSSEKNTPKSCYSCLLNLCPIQHCSIITITALDSGAVFPLEHTQCWGVPEDFLSSVSDRWFGGDSESQLLQILFSKLICLRYLQWGVSRKSPHFLFILLLNKSIMVHFWVPKQQFTMLGVVLGKRITPVTQSFCKLGGSISLLFNKKTSMELSADIIKHF